MIRHRIKFSYSGQPDDEAVELAFSKKKIDDRKAWLTRWMDDRKVRREQGEFEEYLYERDTRSVNFSDFVNKEVIYLIVKPFLVTFSILSTLNKIQI